MQASADRAPAILELLKAVVGSLNLLPLLNQRDTVQSPNSQEEAAEAHGTLDRGQALHPGGPRWVQLSLLLRGLECCIGPHAVLN